MNRWMGRYRWTLGGLEWVDDDLFGPWVWKVIVNCGCGAVEREASLVNDVDQKDFWRVYDILAEQSDLRRIQVYDHHMNVGAWVCSRACENRRRKTERQNLLGFIDLQREKEHRA